MANTKLDILHKSVLKALRVCQNVTVGHNGETTIVYREVGNTVEFALSVASPDERKFRRKVGEYFARLRMDSGETVKMAAHDFYCLRDTILGISV